MAEKTRCIVKKPMSTAALFVLAGAAVGTMLYAQNAPVGAVVGGFVVMFVLKAM